MISLRFGFGLDLSRLLIADGDRLALVLAVLGEVMTPLDALSLRPEQILDVPQLATLRQVAIFEPAEVISDEVPGRNDQYSMFHGQSGRQMHLVLQPGH